MMPEAPAKKVEKPAVEKAPAISVDASRVWGGIVRKLRKAPGKTILWVACQEMTATVENGELTIFVSSENEKKLVTSKDNLDTLYSLSNEFGVQNIKVINGKAENTANPEEIAKAFFQDALKIKKEN
jgi:hypothetical protein